MKGTTAYDGACACGGLIEIDPKGDHMKDVTVPASRDLQRVSNRIATAYRAEKDPERAAVVAQAIMAIDRALSAVLDINKYDESKPIQFTASTCPGRPCGSECDHRGRI